MPQSAHPILTEFRSYSPNGDAQIVHRMPAPSSHASADAVSKAKAATAATIPLTSQNTNTTNTVVLHAGNAIVRHRGSTPLSEAASSSSSSSSTARTGTMTTNNPRRPLPRSVDPVSQWRRYKIATPSPPSTTTRYYCDAYYTNNNDNNNNDDPTKQDDHDDDALDDATSFSSLRVVRDQDKPSSQWRQAVLRRKRRQLAHALATGQWDALRPGYRAASLLEQVVGGTHHPASSTSTSTAAGGAGSRTTTATTTDNHSQTSTMATMMTIPSRILPFIPDVLPKAQSHHTTTPTNNLLLDSSYPLQRKDAKKRKEATFTYFCGGSLSSAAAQPPSSSPPHTNAAGVAVVSPHPTSLVDSVSSFFNPCSGTANHNPQRDTRPAASSLLARLTCQEGAAVEDRQDVLETTTLLRTLQNADTDDDDDDNDDNNNNKEERQSPDNNIYRTPRKNSHYYVGTTNQRAEVAREVVKLRKELKRLKRMVQVKRNKRELRERAAWANPSTVTTNNNKTLYPAHASGDTTTSTAAATAPSLGESVQASATTFATTSTSTTTTTQRMTLVAPYNASKVRFTAPFVTQVHYRPYTDPEDIEKLYFIEEELNELEWDRQTVADDQFEVVVVSDNDHTNDDGPMDVRIAHQKRRLLALHPQESLPHTMSDLSIY